MEIWVEIIIIIIMVDNQLIKMDTIIIMEIQFKTKLKLCLPMVMLMILMGLQIIILWLVALELRRSDINSQLKLLVSIVKKYINL